MLCILAEPIDVAMFVKIHNLVTNGIGSRAGASVVEFLHRTNLANMVKSEKLHIVGHGSGTTMGTAPNKYSAERLADTLVKRGLRGDIASIKLSGCKTGELPASGPPYCQVVADKIFELTKARKQDGPIRLMIVGLTFFAVTSQAGKVRAKDPVKRDTHKAEYDNIVAGRDTTWDSYAATLPIGSSREIIQSAETIAALTKDFFALLYVHNEKVIQDKAGSRFKAYPMG